MKKLNKKLWVSLLASVLIWGLGQGAMAAEYVIKAVSAWPQSVYEVQNFLKFLDIVQKNVAAQAPGRLEIRYLGGPEVIPNREQVEALRTGSVDMVFSTSGYYVSAVPVVDGLNLTEFTPAEERQRGVNDFLNKIHNEKVNAQYMGRLGVDLPFMLFLNKPISKVSDLKGLKIRCSPTHIEFLKKVGAQPVVIPPPDVHTALERGVVDGLIWVAGLIRDWGWNEVVKYRVEPGFYMANNVVLVNKEVWDSLPADLQQILTQSEIEAEKAAVDRGEAHMAEENAIMAKGGMELIELAPDEAGKLKDTAYGALWEVVIKKSGEDGEKLKGMISK